MLYGVGIDVVDVGRFRAALERRGERLLKRLFTERELEYCLRKRRPEEHLSARFAAKVSLFKALKRGFAFTEVEVLNDKKGSPLFRFSRRARLKGLRLNVTISHTGTLSIAETVVERLR